MVSGVVTRSPAAKLVGTPSRSSWASICGPPPCTTTGRSPAYRRNTMSSAKACRSSSLTIALPPNLITTVSPWNRFSHGSASISVAGLGQRGLAADGRRHGFRGTVLRGSGHVRSGHVEYAEFSCT